MEAFTQILGKSGLIIFIGIMVFIYTYVNSIKLFQWIEDQTLGTKRVYFREIDFTLYQDRS